VAERFYLRHAPVESVGAVKLPLEHAAGEHKLSARDEAGDLKPDEAQRNDLGYLHDGVVGHLIEVL
jgi:hypothetical protein